MLVAFLTVLAGVLRTAVAFKGGIWSDEGFFLSVIQMPSWSGMIEFLRLHESHPPLFYAVMRVWGTIAGFGERQMLILPIVLGAAAVPVTYLSGRSLYSERAGLIAAALVAMSVGLVEYSGQIRPYCVLPTLALVSSWMLVTAVQRGTARAWSAYAFWTTAALYTHNWVWLVGAGQVVAFAVIVRRKKGISSLAKAFVMSWAAILIMYLPWMSAFIYQAAHAGHPPFLVDRSAGFLGLYVYGVLSIPQLLLLGTPQGDATLMVALGSAAAAAAALVTARHTKLPTHVAEAEAAAVGNRECDRAFLCIAVTALTASLALSPWSNLLIGRVAASLLPMVILVFASWVSRSLQAENVRSAPLAAALLAFIGVAWLVALVPTIRYPRSNFRDLATILDREKQPTDLLVLASELYAPVFNRYFSESIEQSDFPNGRRARLVGFANLYERAADSVPLAGMRRRVVEAERSGRRLWLVSSTRLVKPDSSEIAVAVRQENARTLWRLRIAQVQEIVAAVYGPPDSVFATNSTTARYDRLKLELFRPARR